MTTTIEKIELMKRQVSKINELLPIGTDKLAMDEDKHEITLPDMYHEGRMVSAGTLTFNDADGLTGTINYLWGMQRAFEFIQAFLMQQMAA